MKQFGKKHKEWIKAKKVLIEESVANGIISMSNGYPEGICKDCGHWHSLTPDHIIKRSQGGGHDISNIDWVCNEPPCMCHDKRDNLGDPMKTKQKAQEEKGKKSNKANFMKPRVCKFCKQHNPGMAQCPSCKKWDI